MNLKSRILPILAIVAPAFAGMACAGDSLLTPTTDTEVLLLSVNPPGGATNVPLEQPVTIEFDHAMAAGMESYADLHEDDLAAPPLAGTWMWSVDRTRLTFMPAAPLEPNTIYVVHLGGSMMDVAGMPVEFEPHGVAHEGGEWASGDMMNQGWSGGPGMGSGMGGPGEGGGLGDGGPYHGHMGEGWQHANGSYGMVFAFRTIG